MPGNGFVAPACEFRVAMKEGSSFISKDIIPLLEFCAWHLTIYFVGHKKA